MNIYKWIEEKILFLLTLLLLAFIPLYPKIPLLDVKNTWVYVRLEDFIVVLVMAIWWVFLMRKKITLRTPLTLPILFFWITGAIATIHGVLLIYPTLANVFPNVAFLSFLRRIEYMSLFFLAYAGMKDKSYLKYVIAVLALTVVIIGLYGIGQRYLGFPAYLTMNEEFAKGEPIKLSRLSRVPSTFAGHYDLAAYLVLMLPIFTSLIFGVRKWALRILFLAIIFLGLVVMFMTVSRVSFFVLFIALGIALLLNKKKLIFLILPVILVMLVFLFSYAPALWQRFGNTIREVDVIVDATSGNAVGEAKEVSSEKFKNKLIVQDYLLDKYKDSIKNTDPGDEFQEATTGADLKNSENKTVLLKPGVVPYYILPDKVTLLVPANVSTGENLPQGTGYINLSLAPVKKRIGEYFYETQAGSVATGKADVIMKNGIFLIKRASAYDLSFTTRFQGEWPNALKAFMRNIFLGSGYGSISLAIDNNYLRILGEVGLIGSIAFLMIFAAFAIYTKKTLAFVDSKLTRSFILGFSAGLVGLGLNAILIDVFEASKIAFSLWLLTGISLGLLSLYHQENFDTVKELRKFIVSTPAIVVYLGLVIIFLYSPMLNNYFIGDDFTWFRWAAENKNFIRFFTHADGFFYRPGTKLYFQGMYSIFWLNQAMYHTVSLVLHFLVTVMVFLLAKKIIRNYAVAVLSAFIFVLSSGYTEATFWISSTGYLFTTFFSLLSLWLFINWREKRQASYFILSLFFLIAGMLFHELGIVTPFMHILYLLLMEKREKGDLKKIRKIGLILLSPLVIYLLLRYSANSHWLSGDYNYNPLKLPFNLLGNSLGYILLGTFGPIIQPAVALLRSLLREQVMLALLVMIIVSVILFFIYRLLLPKLHKESKSIISFSALLFMISLLPFLGLGNIASRYSYLSSVSIAYVFAYAVYHLYNHLRPQGRTIAVMSVSVGLSVFFLLHLIQIQQIHGDWHTAGEKANKFLIAVDASYADYWATEPMIFYFVNVPIKTGEAWIFPVGLKDALWFSLRNPRATVNYVPTVNQALKMIDGSRNMKVFEFDDSGMVIEHRKKIVQQ